MAGLQGLRSLRRPWSLVKATAESSHGLTPFCRVLQAPSRLAVPNPSEEGRNDKAPPVRSLPLQRLPAQGSGILTGLPKPAACACRFSQPLGAFIRPEPGGLVSCRIRSWGCTLQSFAPPVQPYAVSGAFALLSFALPRYAAPPTTETDRSLLLLSAQSTASSTEAENATPRTERTRSKTPPSGSCSTRESATLAGGLDRRNARSSPGLCTLQGLRPRWLGTASPRLPSHACLSYRPQATRTRDGATGFALQRERLVSRRRQPTLMGFAAS
jgi:hypothetical protein